MTMRKLFCYGLLMIMTLYVKANDHNPVLPQPQKIIYGKGQLFLKGLTIGFASKPGVEDIFAAQELSVILSKIISTPVLVKETKIIEASIVFERTGDINPLPLPGEKTGPSSRESYKIKVTPGNVRITAPSSAGLFYAVQTLRQMIEGNGDKALLPEVEIEDWPSMAYRGFMMDMSHTQLPKIEEIKQQIDFLSRWKTNQYFFYSEASIELDGYPLLMADARYKKEQVKEIIEYAKARHIDVIPNMELYGHLHDLFRLEHYSDLSVIPHGGEFIPDDPRVKPILNDWITQISELFPSPFFHIGFDETWLLEDGAKKLNKSPEELYLAMLKQTTDIVERQGKIPLIWADMLQKYPSIIPKVSKKTIAVPWHYFPLNVDKYHQLFSPFSNAGIEIIVQSAIINWEWLVPASDVSSENTDLIIKAGRKYNVIGFINSGWTDDTQTLMRLGFPDMAYGSVASWQSDPVDRVNFFNNYSKAQYPQEISGLVEKAHKSLMVAGSLLKKSFGQTDAAIWANPFSLRSLKIVKDNKENIRNARLAAEDAQIYIKEVQKYGVDTTTFYAMLTGARMLDYLALKYLYADEIAEFWKQMTENTKDKSLPGLIYREITFKYHTRTSDMLDAIIELKEIFQKAWLNEYTPFRLGVALGKYDLEFQYWLRLQRRLEEVNRNFRADEPVPSLESLTKID